MIYLFADIHFVETSTDILHIILTILTCNLNVSLFCILTVLQ